MENKLYTWIKENAPGTGEPAKFVSNARLIYGVLGYTDDITMDEIHELVSHLGNKEKLFSRLAIMFKEAVQRMIDDTGDTEWTFSETHPAVPSKLYKSIKS